MAKVHGRSLSPQNFREKPLKKKSHTLSASKVKRLKKRYNPEMHALTCFELSGKILYHLLSWLGKPIVFDLS